MGNVHVEYVEDSTGDLVDILYWHHGCAPESAEWMPSPESLDYTVSCQACEERIHEVPLTADGLEYTHDGIVNAGWPKDLLDAYDRRELAGYRLDAFKVYLDVKAEGIQRAVEASQLLSAIGSHFA